MGVAFVCYRLRIQSGLFLSNTVLSGNTAGTGGGLSAVSSNSGHISVSLVNAVIAENAAAKGGAVYAYSEAREAQLK